MKTNPNTLKPKESKYDSQTLDIKISTYKFRSESWYSHYKETSYKGQIYR
jgi:hypothetical protein